VFLEAKLFAKTAIVLGVLALVNVRGLGQGPRFCLYIHHTDAEREWAYDRTSHIGKLDKGLDEATRRGWTLVDMKQDWKDIFPPIEK